MKRIDFRFAILLMIVLVTTSGCASNKATATVDSTVDLTSLRTFHVKKYSEDTRDTNLVIKNKLNDMGFKITEIETDADAVLTYIDNWFWDITFYMLELAVSIRDPKTNYPFASANSLHSSLTRKSQEGMVDEVLNNIFSKHQQQGAIDVK